ncbi:MAG: TldD/PmbA family protein [Candidatus Coatesbacteria bacterium]|nr:TldD/PmbA family protein [Candidatus Coatesbacteria bacterium]
MKKKLFKLRDEARKLGADFAEFRFVEKNITNIQLQDKKIDKLDTGNVFGMGIRVLYDGAWGFASTNSDKDSDIKQCLLDALEIAKIVSRNRKEKIILAKAPAVEGEVEIPVKINPRNVSLKEKIKMLRQHESVVISKAKDYLANLRIFYHDLYHTETLCNTYGTFLKQSFCLNKIYVFVVTQDGNIRQSGLRFTGRVGGYEVMKEIDPEKFSIHAATDALDLLTAKPPKAGAFPTILDPSLVGLFVHEAFGHNAEADLVQGGDSIIKGKVGDQIASPLVTIIDDGSIPETHGHYIFDSEGVPAQKTILIENGVLKGFMYNLQTAGAAGTTSTGNGRSQDHRFPPIVRQSVTYMLPGDTKEEDLYKDIDEGVYLKGFGGGYVDTSRGQFTFNANRAWMIKNGKLAEPLRDVCVSGLTLETLSNIEAIGNVLHINEPGTCGKDGQGMPVDNGGPMVRVSKMVIGGQE